MRHRFKRITITFKAESWTVNQYQTGYIAVSWMGAWVASCGWGILEYAYARSWGFRERIIF